MQTTYTGIDYGHGRSNINSATGIRFGVISQNSVSPEAMDDCFFNGRDLTHEACVAEFRAKLNMIEGPTTLALLCEGYGMPDPEIESPETLTAQELWDELEQSFNDAYSMTDCGERDWLWEEQGYKLTNCLQSDVMVLSSPFYTYAQFCSPCAPGACNLDSPLITPPDGVHGGNDFEHDWQKLRDNHCYCLGHDWFESGRAPYPVYSVETGELVAPADA